MKVLIVYTASTLLAGSTLYAQEKEQVATPQAPRLSVIESDSAGLNELKKRFAKENATYLYSKDEDIHVFWFPEARPASSLTLGESDYRTKGQISSDSLSPSMRRGNELDPPSIPILLHRVKEKSVAQTVKGFAISPSRSTTAEPSTISNQLETDALMVSQKDLEHLARTDGVVYIEPMAEGVRTAGGSTAFIAASQTERTTINTSTRSNVSLEIPQFPAQVGWDYVNYLQRKFATLNITPSDYTAPGNYSLVTSIDSGIDNGELETPSITELYIGGIASGGSRYAAGFQWDYAEQEVKNIPTPEESFPYVEFKGDPLLLTQPPLPDDRNDSGPYEGHGSGVIQMAVAHDRPGEGPWRDEATGLTRSLGVSPFGRLAIGRWPTSPFPISAMPGGDDATPPPANTLDQYLHPQDILRTAGEIHRQQYYADTDPVELAKGYTSQSPSIRGNQLAIVNGSMGIMSSSGNEVVFNYSSYAAMFDKLTRSSRPSNWYQNVDLPGTVAETLFVIAAGNSNQGNGEGSLNSIWTPGIAKNVLTVGGSGQFEFLTYGESLPVIGTMGPTANEFAYRIDKMSISSGEQTTAPSISSGTNPLVISPSFQPGTSADGCNNGSFSITMAVTGNPQDEIPTHFTILLLIPEAISITSTESGDLGSVSTKEVYPGFYAISTGGNLSNQDRLPGLFTLNFEVTNPSGSCSPYDLLFTSFDGLWRNGNNGADTSYGVDPALAYPATTGAPQRRIKPDVTAVARFTHQRQYPDLYYTAVYGTSQATGMTSGFAQLSRFVLENYYNRTTISPALLKAFVIHSARPINGTRTGLADNSSVRIPSPYQGYGRIDVDFALDPLPRFFVDQTVVFAEKKNGDPLLTRQAYPGQPVVSTEPTQVALVWTDAAGIPGAERWVGELRNNLDLHVQIQRPDGSLVYTAGNNFSSDKTTLSQSVIYDYPAGADRKVLPTNPWPVIEQSNPGSLDSYNNAEMIQIPAQPEGSTFKIFVRASKLIDDALDPFGDNPPPTGVTNRQDFALVVSNFELKPSL